MNSINNKLTYNSNLLSSLNFDLHLSSLFPIQNNLLILNSISSNNKWDGKIYLINTNTLDIIASSLETSPSSSLFYSSKFLDQENILISGSDDGIIRIYNINLNDNKSINLVKEYSLHDSIITSVAPINNNSTIISSSNEGAINIFDFETENIIWSNNNSHFGTISSVDSIYSSSLQSSNSTSPSTSSIFLSAGHDKYLRLWDYRIKPERSFNLIPHQSSITTASFLNENEIVSGDTNGNIYIYDIRNNEKTLKLYKKIHFSSITKIKLIDNNNILSCSNDTTISIINENNNIYQSNNLSTFHTNSVTDFHLLDNNNINNNFKLLTISNDKLLNIINYSLDIN